MGNPKYVVVLEGTSHSGKTTTLNYLIELLNPSTSTPNSTLPNLTISDKEVCIVTGHGKKVVICTAGDYKKNITGNFSYCGRQGSVDVFVTALSAKRGFRSCLDKEVDRHKSILIRVPKESTTNSAMQDIENLNKAKDLKALIDTLP